MTDNTMIEVTNAMKNIVKGCKIIIESGDHKMIARLHATNDFYLNELERIIYGQTIKEMRNAIIKKDKKGIKKQ